MKKIIRNLMALLICAASVGGLCLYPAAAAIRPWEKNDDGVYYGASSDGSNLTPAPGVTCRGIDISVHNGDVNWNEIARQYAEGTISFVILRCGYGSDIASQDDSNWVRNANACRDLGIPFGVYLYSYALTKENSLSEAEHVLRLVKDYTLTYPIYYDFENTKTQSSLPGDLVAEMVDTFCGRIQEEGYEVGFYSMRSWITNRDHLGQVDYTNKNYSLWIAEFGPRLNYSGPFDIWQCTSSASVSGSSARTDVSFSYIPERKLSHCYVTFDLGEKDGRAPAPIHADRDVPIGELPEGISYDGKKCTGWYTAPVGGERITAETPVPVNGKMTLYAHWSCDIEINASDVSLSGGDSLQTVTSEKPFEAVSITAADGFYLPSDIDVPAGFSYKTTDEKHAVIECENPSDAVIGIAGVKNGTHEPVLKSKISVTPATADADDGTITVSGASGCEVCVSGVWKPLGADGTVSGLPAGKYAVRRAASNGLLTSAETEVTVKRRALSPLSSDFPVSFKTSDGITSCTVSFPAGDYLYSTDGATYLRVPENRKLQELAAWRKLYVIKAGNEEFADSLPSSVSLAPIRQERCFNYLSAAILTKTPKTAFDIDGETVMSDQDGFISIKEEWFGKTLTVIPLSLKNDADACSAEISVPARPPKPVITVENESVFGKNDGRITGLTEDMQYTLNGVMWQLVTKEMAENGPDFEYGRTYGIRYIRYGEGNCFPGEVAEITVLRGEKLRVVFDNNGEKTEYYLGYGDTVAMPPLPENALSWSEDISGKPIYEDITVVAIYPEKKGCGSAACGYGVFAALLSAACVSGKRKKNRMPNGINARKDKHK
ncbi:MAG: InlB B-repeat-containing protein [Clostridia bacterium]|nr:InlB B-repeat-containing protein [Clostridia bacterium]